MTNNVSVKHDVEKNGKKKAEKMRSSENRKTTMSRIQLHRLARLASLLKRNGYASAG